MANYDFSTLNDKDLEELALDLLNAELNLGLQSFKVGKDGGIDLRYSSPENNNEIVVQVKHYLNSGYTQLKSDLKNKELPKVKNLKPARYLVVTSLALSAVQKDGLKKIFEPFIVSSNDIFGRSDLNKLLRKHKEVQKTHFKLWFSSSVVLSSIINNAIEGRSKSYLEKILKNFKLLVVNQSFDDANKILERQKVLLISGLAGIGKTTLANALLLEKAKNKYKVFIIKNIREAEDVISVDEKEKQVFYFDDFLGDVYYQLVTGSQTESEIKDFVERIKDSPNKYLILSTRTVILEQAIIKSEKIKRTELDSSNYELKIKEYSDFDKAKILYNHLYFNSLNEEFIFSIIENKFYNYIIKHKSYSPRIIEFFTKPSRINNLDKTSFLKFIRHNLAFPSEIWQDSFENQITNIDRSLLFTLFTFNKSIDKEILVSAFKERLKYEKSEYNLLFDSGSIQLAFRNVQNGFILLALEDIDKQLWNVSFINPSLADYLTLRIKQNFNETSDIVSSIKYFEQLQIFNKKYDRIPLKIEQQEIIKKNILNNQIQFISETNVGYFNLGKKLEILKNVCGDLDNDLIYNQLLIDIGFDNYWLFEWFLTDFLLEIDNAPLTMKFIHDNFEKIIISVYRQTRNAHILHKIPDIFKKFGFDFDKYYSTTHGFDFVNHVVSSALQSEEQELFEAKRDALVDKSDLDVYVYEELESSKDTYIEKLNLNPDSIQIERNFDNDELETIIEQNNIRIDEGIKREKELESVYHKNELDMVLEKKKIEDLFYHGNFKEEELPF